VQNSPRISTQTDDPAGRNTRSSATLYGLSADGDLVHSEAVGDDDLDALRTLADVRLADFPMVEIWIESIRVIRLRRDSVHR
jgi:hypothetical protein